MKLVDRSRIALDKIVDMGLCLRPRPDHWDADVAEIAAVGGVNRETLARYFLNA